MKHWDNDRGFRPEWCNGARIARGGHETSHKTWHWLTGQGLVSELLKQIYWWKEGGMEGQIMWYETIWQTDNIDKIVYIHDQFIRLSSFPRFAEFKHFLQAVLIWVHTFVSSISFYTDNTILLIITSLCDVLAQPLVVAGQKMKSSQRLSPSCPSTQVSYSMSLSQFDFGIATLEDQ